MATTSAPARPARSGFLLDLYRSALGKKYLMAVSGIVGLGYVLAHMLGNLKLYQSAADFNAYAAFLRRLLYPILPESGTLNLLRLVLIAALVVQWGRGRPQGGCRCSGRAAALG